MRSIAVVGASLAGLSTARALRNQGYDGDLSIVGAEVHRPYDRPPLSKGFLSAQLNQADLTLEAEGEDLGAHWHTGVAARGLHLTRRSVELSDGSELVVDAVVVATGAVPRTIWDRPPRGVHLLRTLDDAIALRTDLVAGARLAVVGAGFIGAEVAATASSMGLSVTIVEAAPTALAGPLGLAMGTAVAGVHADHGVRLLCGVDVVGLVTAATSMATATGARERVTAVELADGRRIAADVVVVGVGVRPAVGWLAGSGLDTGNGVRCDEVGTTSIPTVAAVGDCATWYEPSLGDHHRLEHWTGARERGAIVAAALLSGGSDRRAGRPPYFWSEQYGLMIQMAGHRRGADRVDVAEGSAAARDFLAVYRRDGEPVAVLAMARAGSPTARSFTRWRRRLSAVAGSSASFRSAPTATRSLATSPGGARTAVVLTPAATTVKERLR